MGVQYQRRQRLARRTPVARRRAFVSRLGEIPASPGAQFHYHAVQANRARFARGTISWLPYKHWSKSIDNQAPELMIRGHGQSRKIRHLVLDRGRGPVSKPDASVCRSRVWEIPFLGAGNLITPLWRDSQTRFSASGKSGESSRGATKVEKRGKTLRADPCAATTPLGHQLRPIAIRDGGCHPINASSTAGFVSGRFCEPFTAASGRRLTATFCGIRNFRNVDLARPSQLFWGELKPGVCRFAPSLFNKP